MQKTPDGSGYISTSDPTRKTLGTQIVEKEKAYLDDPHVQEVGETLSELGKTICKGLEEGINNARSKNIQGKIYIYIVETPMPSSINKPAVQLTFFTRRTRPTPEWNTCLYSHEEGDSVPKLEWALPQYNHKDEILRNPSRYTPQQANWVKLMDCGLLI